MPSAYFKFVLEHLGTTRALRAAILEGTGVDPANVASLGEEITVGQQLRQNRNVNAVAPPGWGLAIVVRNDARNEPEALRLAGLELAAGQDVPRVRGADRAREQPGDAELGARQAVVDSGVPKRRRASGDAEIRAERETEPAAISGAVHGRDDGLRELPQRRHEVREELHRANRDPRHRRHAVLVRIEEGERRQRRTRPRVTPTEKRFRSAPEARKIAETTIRVTSRGGTYVAIHVARREFARARAHRPNFPGCRHRRRARVAHLGGHHGQGDLAFLLGCGWGNAQQPPPRHGRELLRIHGSWR
jgi:hypothetical protein